MTATQQIIFQVFGGILVVVGVGFIFFGKTEGRNAFKVGGVEFELSGPAILVFLGGLALFVLPVVLPARLTDERPLSLIDHSPPNSQPKPVPNPPPTPGPIPAADGNTSARQAMEVPLKQPVRAAATGQQKWYRFSVAPSAGGLLTIHGLIRNVDAKGCLEIHLYNSDESQRYEGANAICSNWTFTIRAEKPTFYYVMVRAPYDTQIPVHYDVEVNAE